MTCPRPRALHALALLVAGCGLCALTLPAQAQFTASQIVAKSLAARGGAGRFAQIRTMKATKELILANGQHAQVLIRSKGADKTRIDIRFADGAFTQAFDGRLAWQMNPSSPQPQILRGRQRNTVEDTALGFLDLSVEPTARGTRIDFAGAGKLDGRAYLAVRYTLKTGDVFVQYFDPKTWLAFHEQYPSQGAPGEESIDDYRPVQGLLFPFHYVSGPKGGPLVRLERGTMDLNVPISDAIFRKPAAPTSH